MTTRDILSPLAPDAARLARLALDEDGVIDLTTELVADGRTLGAATDTARSSTVLAGTAYADAIATLAGCRAVDWLAAEGDRVERGAAVGSLEGPRAGVLRAERPLLNVLQRACGIAAQTRSVVDALAGTPCVVLHTRKTAPGLRGLDVRAVLAGGGALHRAGLDREVMVKDNHWAAMARTGQSLADVLAAARARGAERLHVEVESQEQVVIACEAGATRLLIDNQRPQEFAALAARARRLVSDIELEATGGITASNARAYADSGADYVSIGALTHSVVAADISLALIDR